MPVGGRAIGKTGFSSGLSASGKDFTENIKNQSYFIKSLFIVNEG